MSEICPIEDEERTKAQRQVPRCGKEGPELGVGVLSTG